MANRSLLTVKQVSDILAVPPRTIQRWINDKRLPAVRIARTCRIPSEAITRLYQQALQSGEDCQGAP